MKWFSEEGKRRQKLQVVRPAAEGEYKERQRQEWQEKPRGVSSWDRQGVDTQSGVRRTVAASEVRIEVPLAYLAFGGIRVAVAVGGSDI